MIFNTVPNPMDRSYYETAMPENEEAQDIEEPIGTVNDIGTSTTEFANQQSLVQGAQAEIKKGVGKIELATGMGGPTNPVGAESYGEEARRTLREIRQASNVEYTSVHVPTQVNGLSGYNPQQGGFSDDARKMGMDEISKAVRFAADAAGGGAVVVHQSEYDRPISEQDWAREHVGYDEEGNPKYKHTFMGSMEEPNRATFGVVDKKSGKVQRIAQKNMTIQRPKWKKAEEAGWVYDNRPGKEQWRWLDAGQQVTIDGLPVDRADERCPEITDIDEHGNWRFETEKLSWHDIEKEAHEKGLDPAVHFYQTHMQQQYAQQMGQALLHSRGYKDSLHKREKLKEALEFYSKLENEVPAEERWKIQVPDKFSDLVPAEATNPTDKIREMLEGVEHQISMAHESSAMASSQAQQVLNEMENYESIHEYALKQTEKSLAQAGVEAMEQTKNNPNSEKPTFISVENWDPSMYGGHPKEMTDLIDRGRRKMYEYLTNPEIKPVEGDNGHGETMVNPYYDPNLSKEEAWEKAQQHIKMTLDTEHLALWRKKFMGEQGKTREETNKDFENWYLEQIDELAKQGYIGHVHLVDSIEGGHQHLPAGEGELPLKEVVQKLKDHGLADSIVSEAHGENSRFGAARQATKTWEHFGHGMYQMGSGPGRPHPKTFSQVSESYFGRTQPPMFMYGAYVPSNDYKLWSEVPME